MKDMDVRHQIMQREIDFDSRENKRKRAIQDKILHRNRYFIRGVSRISEYEQRRNIHDGIV